MFQLNEIILIKQQKQPGLEKKHRFTYLTMPIKELPLHLRPREKSKLQGFKSLSEIELLAIFIKNGNKRKSAIDIVSDLIMNFKTFENMSKASSKELQNFEGVGEVKALEIRALFEFSRRITFNAPNNDDFKNESNIIKFAQSLIGDSKTEEFLIILFDAKLNLISYKILFKGGSDSMLIDVKEIVKENIVANARIFYCFHNHPSNNVEPSVNDVITTKRIKNYSSLMDIHMKKHFVVTSDDFQEVNGG